MTPEEYASRGWNYLDYYRYTRPRLAQLVGDREAVVVVKLFAATSQAASIASNVFMTLRAYSLYKQGLTPTRGMMKTVRDNVERAVRGEDIRGPKVGVFARAHLGDQTAVTVDRWMCRAYGVADQYGRPKRWRRDIEYVQEAATALAWKMGVWPRDLQAAIWFGVKLEAGMRESEFTRVEDLLLPGLKQQLLWGEDEPDQGEGAINAGRVGAPDFVCGADTSPGAAL